MTETTTPPGPAGTARGPRPAEPPVCLDGGAGERLRTIIERLPDGIVIIDRDGTIRFANPAAERLFNRSADELVGTPFGFTVIGGDTTEIDVMQRGGGEMVHAELRAVETEWEGEVVELLSLRDISDRKRAAERAAQLVAEREARLEAEAASRAKSEFLAIMSHELRTPLNAVLGYSELIELGLSGPLTDEMREQIGRIRSSAKHLLALVNDILDLAKVEAGRLIVSSESASAQEVIATSLALVEPQALAKGVELTVTPDDGTSILFVGDNERARQILVNLLSNAVKFTPSGGTITIESGVDGAPENARVQTPSRCVFVRVTDTGDGIAEGKLAGIFEPFVQADSGTTRSREGSGLGLTISRRLARLMGGDLTVESEVEKGSTFTLWLPADSRETDASAPQADWTGPDRRQDDAGPGHPGPDSTMPIGHSVAGLADIGQALLSGMASTLSAIITRVKCDPNLSVAAGLRNSQVADHLATFLGDVAGALVTIEESGGQGSALLADTIEIQRLISERHGAQRARLGWTESALRREFMIIREELERIVREHLGRPRESEVGDAVAILNRFLDHSEFIAVRSLEASRVT